MPFNPEDFLKLAEKICKDTDYSDVSEATFRTSISRAYYSVFLILRELTKSELYVLDAMLDKVLRSGLVHSCIKRVVGIVIGRFAEQVYSRLLYLRKKSDYDIEATIKIKDVRIAEIILGKRKDFQKRLKYPIVRQEVSKVILNYYQKLFSMGSH